MAASFQVSSPTNVESVGSARTIGTRFHAPPHSPPLPQPQNNTRRAGRKFKSTTSGTQAEDTPPPARLLPQRPPPRPPPPPPPPTGPIGRGTCPVRFRAWYGILDSQVCAGELKASSTTKVPDLSATIKQAGRRNQLGRYYEIRVRWFLRSFNLNCGQVSNETRAYIFNLVRSFHPPKNRPPTSTLILAPHHLPKDERRTGVDKRRRDLPVRRTAHPPPRPAPVLRRGRRRRLAAGDGGGCPVPAHRPRQRRGG